MVRAFFEEKLCTIAYRDGSKMIKDFASILAIFPDEESFRTKPII